MITLATLKDATEQQVFDQVAKHLLTQMKQSQLPTSQCVYRGPEGLMCAAGCLIGDDEYVHAMDASTPDGDNTWPGLVAAGLVGPTHKNLIYSLQQVHDGYSPFDWKTGLNRVAIKYNLNPVVEQ